MKRYEGNRENGLTAVTVDGVPLNPRLDLRKHSITGYDWGYGGSGPAQLALALLPDHLNDDRKALELYQSFKFAAITTLPRRSWALTSDQIEQAVKSLTI